LSSCAKYRHPRGCHLLAIEITDKRVMRRTTNA
jgi:hypothetical protein